MVARDRSDLCRRILSSLVLVPAVLAAAWAGALTYALLLGLSAFVIAAEWIRLVGARAGVHGFWVGAAGVAAGLVVGSVYGPGAAFAALVVAIFSAGLVCAFAGGPVVWAFLGTVYAGLPIICLATLRGTEDVGLAATVWLLVLVWSADSCAFAVGRLLDGPRLAPRISPNKTWAGAIAAVLAALAVGLATALVLGDTSIVGLGAASAVVGVAVVFGDLVESALKRRFGAKDTGSLIPGHGGLMDRVDSLAAAAVVAVVVGMARGGVDGAAEGVLEW